MPKERIRTVKYQFHTSEILADYIDSLIKADGLNSADWMVFHFTELRNKNKGQIRTSSYSNKEMKQVEEEDYREEETEILYTTPSGIKWKPKCDWQEDPILIEMLKDNEKAHKFLLTSWDEPDGKEVFLQYKKDYLNWKNPKWRKEQEDFKREEAKKDKEMQELIESEEKRVKAKVRKK